MRPTKYHIMTLLLLAQFLACIPLFAQVKVQVVSQEISKSFVWQQGMSLWINAEHAEIHCTSHKANTVVMNLTITSKHEVKSTAESDIKKMKWLNETKGSKIFIRNYIELAKNETQPESAIKFIYHIQVPENCPVNIQNYFGKIMATNLHSTLQINSEFSMIDLKDLGGEKKITTLYGNISANAIEGETTIESNRSDIILVDFEGKLKINATLAQIRLSEMKPLSNIDLVAEKSEVYIKVPDLNRFAWQIEYFNCDVNIPENMKPEYSWSKKKEIKAVLNPGNNDPVININLNTGSLNIEQQ